jgi:hypothetical protein
MTTLGAQASPDTYNRLPRPTPGAKPRVWWHWMNGYVTTDGFAADLEWMNGGMGSVLEQARLEVRGK